jgi:hypothetical protein
MMRLAVFFAAALLTMLARTGVVRAQDHDAGHAQYHEDFYKHWMQPGVLPPVSCCNVREVFGGGATIKGDCYPTQFRLKPTGCQAKLAPEDIARLGKEWINVPSRKIIREKNPDSTGRDGHLCVSISTGEVLCAVPPTGTF